MKKLPAAEVRLHAATLILIDTKLRFDMRKYNYDLHPRQIPTKLYIIKEELHWCGSGAIYALLKCLAGEPDEAGYKNCIVTAAVAFEQVSRLICKNKENKYVKLSVKSYKKEIFESYAENPEEVLWRGERYGVTPDRAERIFRILCRIADLVCPMMACTCEHAYVSEYAYAIDYVIRHGGELPKPEIKLLFPSNYPDFNYTEGIAKEINEYFML